MELSKRIINQIQSLSAGTGVYLFLQGRKIIYIGKAINIKERVKNHFFQPTYKDAIFINSITDIQYVATHSEIEALLLEAELIKKHQPKFNQVWRDDKNYFYIAIAKNKNNIPYIFITHQPAKVSSIRHKVSGIERKNILNTKYQILNTQHIGPFVEGASLKKTLKFLRKAFPYYTSQSHPKKPCTWCHLDLCPGTNPDLGAYGKNIKKLVLILQGKRKTALAALTKEMKSLSEQKKFEEASNIRDKIFALQNIMAHAHVIAGSDLAMAEKWLETQKILQKLLGMKKPVSKIECYDISNIQGKQAVGSMVVFYNGKPDTSQYKKFRIRMENTPNDIAMLKEVLGRRLKHPEWDYPDAMLIDGGIAQLNVSINAKNNSPETEKIKIISIAKGRQELFIEGRDKNPIPLKKLPQEIYNLIKHLDDEAHRFAITYHKAVRKRELLI